MVLGRALLAVRQYSQRYLFILIQKNIHADLR